MAARLTAILLITLTAACACAQHPDLLQGNWEGTITSGDGGRIRAEVIGENRSYKAHLFTGEPGEETRVASWVRGRYWRDTVHFSGKANLCAEAGACKLKMKLADGQITGKFLADKPIEFTMTRVEKKSPTLGAQPPEGAVVLFGGSSLSAWKPATKPWRITPEGAFEVGKGRLQTLEELGSGDYHIEFRTPYMPRHKGQGRGNSGVYLFGRYEVQVLDSFGLQPKDNECGGIYKMAVPTVNACLPPAEWQTYDITFIAPEFDAQGSKTKNAVITVRHNGIVIHDKVEIKGVTGGSISDKEASKGPLFLQDHGNRVQYRNIWHKSL